MSERDFDAEFEKLLSDATLESVDSVSADVQEEPPAVDDNNVAYGVIPENLEVEQVRPMEDGRRRVGLVLTEIASARVLQHLLDAEGIKARALGTPSGAVIWVDIVSEDDEFSEFLGSQRPVAPEVETVAQKVSAFLGRSVIALQSWLTMEDDQEDSAVVGQIVAWRYLKGKVDTSLSAGLVVAYVHTSVEDLLVGRTDILNHPNFDPPRSAWSAFKAMGKSFFNRDKEDDSSN
ncbi:hypothetical protein KRX54_05175 [Actinomycetaceae bacterium TAE3-ERU4]|nr:hypothetical protein [Actinomycetaceae bacterium TAE3-ERU4]